MFVSVIMAVYNGAEYLNDAIDSILQQTHSDFEFIVVDDGSTDGTEHLLKQYEDQRLKVRSFTSNRGAAIGLNAAASGARGEWLFIQDADDISDPERLKATIEYIESNPELVAVSTLIGCISGKDPVSEKRLKGYADNWNRIVTTDQVRTIMATKNPLCHGATACRKDVFDRVGGYDASYTIAYDYDLWQKISSLGEIAKVPEVLYHYRIVKHSLSQKNAFRTYNEAIQIATTHMRIKHFPSKRVPKALFIGSRAAYPNVEQNLKKLVPFDCCRYVVEKEIGTKEVIDLFRQEKADCILHLNEHDNPLKEGLLEAGFRQNQDYFQLYSLL